MESLGRYNKKPLQRHKETNLHGVSYDKVFEREKRESSELNLYESVELTN